MASESIAHSAFGLMGYIDSEPIRARGIIVKEAAHTQSCFSSNCNLGMMVFVERGKTGVPGEKPLEARERTKNKLNPHMA